MSAAAPVAGTNNANTGSNKRKGEAAGDGRAVKRPRTMTLFKNVLDSPFHFTWAPLGVNDRNLVVQHLASYFKDFKTIRRHRSKGFKKRQEEKGEPVPEPKPFVAPCLGLNAVTRALERSELALVVLCKNVEPSAVVHHIPLACKTRGVPLCALDMTSEQLAQLVGLEKVIAIGFKKSEPAYQEIVQVILPLCPNYDIPWLQNPAATSSSSFDAEAAPSPSLLPVKYKRAEYQKILDQ